MFNARVMASYTPLSPSRPVVRAAAGAASALVAHANEQVLGWLERVHERRQLAQLSDHMLKDIGLTRADVDAEISKPFWRP